MTRPVGVLLFPGFQLLDATGPVAVFETASELAGASEGYRSLMLSPRGGPVASSAGVVLESRPLSAAPELDTLLVPGGAGTRDPDLDPALLEFLRTSPERTRRTVSVCTGAFLLARAGLLDGRRATTHWRYAARLARDHPAVQVLPDRIWTRDGPLWTSAGVSAGIDLALALVADDLGTGVARRAAREVVVYFQRPGGQSQFSSLEELGGPGNRFTPLLDWVRANVGRPIRVEDLAARAAMSPRNFARRFREEVGRTPARAVAEIRLDVARALVESGREPMAGIARDTGFGDVETMRRAFVRRYGHPPRALRTAAATAGSRDQPSQR